MKGKLKLKLIFKELFLTLFVSVFTVAFSFDYSFSEKKGNQQKKERKVIEEQKEKGLQKKDGIRRDTEIKIDKKVLDGRGDSFYKLSSTYISLWLSDYGVDFLDYLIKKNTVSNVSDIFISRFERIREIMKELIDTRSQIEIAKITKFFSDKMKPFAEVEDLRREELMSSLQKFVGNFVDSNLAPYAILRYAEILYEKLSYEYIQAYEKAVLEGEPPPKKDYSQVVKIYEDFLKKYKDFPRRDIVIYLAGYILDEMGQQEEAVQKYFEPLAKMRISQFAPEAAMRVGEFYFNLGELDKAEQFYIIVLDFPENPFYTKALYKLAWTYFRKGDYSSAIDYFVETVDASLGKEGNERTELIKESIDYIISSIVELGGFDKLERSRKEAILSLLKKIYEVVKSDEYKEPEVFILEAQGRVFFDQGKYQEAIQSFNQIIERYYLSPRSIDAAFGVFESLKKLGDISSAVEWQIKMAGRWGPGSEWAQRNPEKFKTNKSKLEAGLLESAKYYHEKGMIDRAESNYLLFLKLFPESEFSADIQFLLAEIYYQSGRYVPAYNMYKANVENVSVKQNKYLIDAAWGMVLAADKSFEAKITGAGEMLKNASFLFERLFPLDGRVPIALYKAAKVLSSEGKKDDALFILSKIIERYPGSEVVADSILEIFKIYVEKGDLRKVVDFAVQARKRTDILSKEDIDYLNDSGGKALFSIALEYEKAGDYQSAISNYLSLENIFPGHNLIDDAYYRVIMLFNEMRKFNDVISYSDIFLKRFPDSVFRYDILYVRAVAFSTLFFFNQALDTYIQLSKELREKEKTSGLSDIEKDMLKKSYLAVRSIYVGLGDFVKAAEWSMRYYDEFGREESDPMRFIKDAAEFYAKAEKVDEAISLLSRFISETSKRKGENNYDVFVAKYGLAKSYEKKGEREKIEKIFQELMKLWDKLSPEDKSKTISIYSEVKFYFARKTFEEFRKIRITGDEKKKQLAEKLKKKTELLKKIQEEMGAIAKLGDPTWSFAAIFYMGYAYQDYADMLVNSPLPHEIRAIKNPEERELAEAVYREELEKQAFPLEDSAIKIFSGAVERIKQVGVRNEWTALIFKHLKMLDPLSPVEIEDDRVLDVALSYSVKSLSIPKVQEERKKVQFIFAASSGNLYELTDPQKLKNFIFSQLVSDYLLPSFAYYEDGKIKYVSIGESSK